MTTPLDRVVEDYHLEAGARCADLVTQMGRAGGFTAPKLATALAIVREMVERKDCTTFLAFPAALVATGCRGILVEMVRNGLVDVVVTTCGTVDHDLARVRSPYYHGEFGLDDAALHAEDIYRLGNVLVPAASYGAGLEAAVRPFLEGLYEEGERGLSTTRLLHLAGERLGDESSLLYWCARREVPVIVPAITDGAFGSHLWTFWQEHRDLFVDVFADETRLSDLTFDAPCTGALILGGGVSKHHVLWWNQYRGGLDYAVYITTAVEYDGSLSGARVREAISWGKVTEHARRVTVDGDASLLLPLLYAALVDAL